MPRTVMVKATSRMPTHQAKVLAYRTRMMQADIEGGGQFELPEGDAGPLLKAQWVEAVTADAPRRGPGRPRKEAEVAPAAAEAAEEPYAGQSVADLRGLAEKRGVALPSGYIKRSDLIDYLDGKKVHEEPESDEEDDGA